MEWKVAIDDALHAFFAPLVRRSALKLGIIDNLTLLRESRAIAVNFNAKLAITKLEHAGRRQVHVCDAIDWRTATSFRPMRWPIPRSTRT